MMFLSFFNMCYILLKAQSGAEAITGGLAMGALMYLVVWLYNQNKKKVQNKNYQNNFQSAELVTQINPNDSEGLFIVAKDSFKNGNYDEAFNLFRKCLTLNPDKVECLMHLGIIYHTRNDHSNVLYVFEQFSDKLNESKNYLERLENLRKSYLKTLAFFWYVYGYANYKHGNIEQAMKFKKTAINLDSSLSANQLY